jgi:O-antigen/teichoic acid export membrane protein
MTAGQDSGPPPADIQTRANRGMAWIGAASSMVGLLDIIALVLMISFWVSKEEVGTAMLAVSLFPVLDLATDLGLTAAVIQRDDHTREKISTIFWLNFFMSLALASLLAFGVGPAVAALHGIPILAWLLAAYGAKLLWQNVYFIPYALMKRELRFKELSILRVIANLAEFAGKIGFAAAGFGVWAFVAGPLCRVLVTGVGTQILHPWRPMFVLRVREALDWAAYGIKTSASKMLFHLYTNVDYHVVGYFFGPAMNGLYTAAYTLVLQPALVISEVVTNVAFPVFSRLKKNRDALVAQLISFARMNLVVMLLFVGIVLVSTDEIFSVLELVKGEDWGAAAPAARILCIVAVLRGLSFLIPPLLDGVNKPTLTLRYMITASVVMPALFVLFAWAFGGSLGYLSVAVAWAVGYPLAFAVLLFMALSVLELRIGVLLARLKSIVFCAAGATALSAAASLAASPLPGLIRFLLSAAVMIGSFGLLLARFDGLTPRSIVRSLRGSG